MAAVKLSTTLIIVIAVSGSLGCAIVLFLTFKCCRRSKSVPLPPIQPLAHRREKDINCLPRPYIPRDELGQLGRYGSDTSLLKPSRKRSFQTDESHGTPSSSQHSFPVGPSPPTNVTHQPSPLSVESFSDEQTSVTHQYTPTTQQVRSSSRVRPRQSRSRTNSAGSTHISLTHVSTRSGNTIHGAPHSNRSNVQIVLPTPLAPQLLDHMVTNPSMVGNYEELAERGGIADGWTPAPGRITSQRSNTGQDLSKRDGRKTSSSSGHRLRRSLDTMDRPGRSESQTQFRGRTSSHRRIQPQPLSHGDTTASPWTLDNKTQPRRVTLQKPRDRQGNSTTRSLHQSLLNYLNSQPGNWLLNKGIDLPAIQKLTRVLSLCRCRVPTNPRVIPQTFHSIQLYHTHYNVIPPRRVRIPSSTIQL